MRRGTGFFSQAVVAYVVNTYSESGNPSFWYTAMIRVKENKPSWFTDMMEVVESL